MRITLNAVGAVNYRKGLNIRYISDPFKVGDTSITIEVGAHCKGTTHPTIYETGADGTTRGNSKRMIDAGYWNRYEHGYQVNAENLPEYTKAGIVQTIEALYPEINLIGITFKNKK